MNQEQFKEGFRVEADGILESLESYLLQLEQDPSNSECIDAVFRSMHTLKGSGGMFGFQEVAAYTHQLENVFEEVRAGKRRATPELVGLALESCDHVRKLIDECGELSPATSQRDAELLGRLRVLLGHSPAPQAVPSLQSEPCDAAQHAAPADGRRTWLLRLRPAPELFARGGNPTPAFADALALGEGECLVQAGTLPALDSGLAENCYLLFDLLLTTDATRGALAEVFVFIAEGEELEMHDLDQLAGASLGHLRPLLVERLRSGGALTPEQLVVDLPGVQSGAVETSMDLDSLPAAASVTQPQGEPQSSTASASRDADNQVRVPVAKLDRLVDLVGELVIAQSRLRQLAFREPGTELESIAEEMERLTSELRESAMDVRMMPIGTTFARFRRLVRDLGSKLNKDVDLVIEGGDTELDKTVLQQLGDPLVHLVRNSMDHGIETPEDRIAAGKPARATLRISAEHADASVRIEISDDGRGVPRAKVLARAIERGLLPAGSEPSDAEIVQLLFQPGFSTAENVSDVSGRGVGMDAVRRAIQDLRGRLSMHSVEGEGTVVRIDLPLTLAIIEGLMVQVQEDSYILPLDAVEECVELTSDTRREHANGRIVKVRDELIPYLRMREVFQQAGDLPLVEQVVIASVDGERIGIAVDHVIGQHQTVLRSLGQLYQGVPGICGGTILGDGNVALVLDLAGIRRALASVPSQLETLAV